MDKKEVEQLWRDANDLFEKFYQRTADTNNTGERIILIEIVHLLLSPPSESMVLQKLEIIHNILLAKK